MILLLLAVLLGGIHFAIPATYYFYLRSHSDDEWNLDIDLDFRPMVTIILPTYNEGSTIKERLDNVRELDYPSDKLKTLMVDSESEDGTLEIARDWKSKNSELNLEILEEPERRGMISAENFAIERMPEETEIIILTDSDCKWKKDSLKNAVKYFHDPSVGVVTSRIYPYEERGEGLEETYRDFTDTIRLSESRIYSTPIAHGSFLAINRKILEKEMGKLPEWTGADDSPVASFIALNGYRSITAPDVITWEYVPESFSENVKRKVRRGQHLIQNFLEIPKKVEEDERKPNDAFKNIFNLEKFIHVMNPWILLISVILLILSSLYNPFIVLAILGAISIAGITVKSLRSWLLNQGILIYGLVKNLFTRTREWKPLR